MVLVKSVKTVVRPLDAHKEAQGKHGDGSHASNKAQCSAGTVLLIPIIKALLLQEI